MDSGSLRMSMKERRRLVVLHQVSEGGMTLVEAAERMGLCYRQAKRIWARFQRWGEGGLVHRLRGRGSNRRIDATVRAEVVSLIERYYGDFGPTLAAEKLLERHGQVVSRETLRRWMLQERIWLGRQRFRRHRKRRTRRARFGELVQLDGSHHRWLEERAPGCCLMLMVDDATGRGLGHFGAQETTRDALQVLRLWIERYGVPQALYTDRKSLYVTEREPTPQEKRLGMPALTDFGRVCWRLGIELIPAHSPQAKGRIERRNGLLQDRLVKELRLRAVSDRNAANRQLGPLLDALNKRFSVAPQSTVDAHRQRPAGPLLDDLLGVECQRIVQNDWTICFQGRSYQIERNGLLPPARATITVRQRLNNTIGLYYQEQLLKHTCIGTR